MPKDGAINIDTIGTSAAAAVAETGTTKAASPEGHDQQFASAPTASAQHEPFPKDGAPNIDTIGTSAAAAVAETGTTKAASPQHASGSDDDGAINEASYQKGGTQHRDSDVDLMSGIQAVNNGDLKNGAQNEASIANQEGGVQTNRIESDRRNEIQNATDSKNEMENKVVTHISKAQHISSLEPQLKIDQDTGKSEKVHSVLDAIASSGRLRPWVADVEI